PDHYDWNQHPQEIRLAIDLVKVEPADGAVAQHLLGRTIIADSLNDAVLLQKSGPAGYRYVTRAGEVIEADGTFRAGPLTAAMGEDLKLWGEQLTASRMLLGQVQEKQLASQQHVQRQAAAKAELEQQIARIEKSAAAVASRRGGVERELQDAQRHEAQLVEQ